MKIVSFNVNSVRMRFHQLEALKAEQDPDVIGLQETKVQDHDFPIEQLREIGYEAVYIGQKTHYGVAMLYKKELTLKHVQYNWKTDDETAQKRMVICDFVDADGNEIRVLNGYFPQGESRNHEIKFPAKEKFYVDLMAYLNDECDIDQNVVVMGDFNISPEDIDIGIGEPNRKRWLKQGKSSFLPEEREWWASLKNWGLKDTFRTCYPDNHTIYSWFDYRSKGFNDEPKRGLRIDTLLATETLNAKVVDSGICYDIRGMEKPSDHAPVWTEFKL